MEKRIKKNNLLITGAAGFIGSHLARYMVKQYPERRIVCLDKLSYAGNLKNLQEIETAPNYRFVKEDVCHFEAIRSLLREENIGGIVHLAAESHVDRSIKDPFIFAQSNVMGTLTLLQAAKEEWSKRDDKEWCRFYHVSTDEVYGSLAPKDPAFSEKNRYEPHSPYAASKAASDHFVRAYHDTYGLPVLLSNCSNNYGPYQFPEKLIPLFIHNIRKQKALPVYGNGKNIRDWLYVEDHVRAIDLIFHEGQVGETYNIGGDNEWSNIDLIHKLIGITDELLGRESGSSEKLITYIKDRAGHDMRYAIDARKLRESLGWKPAVSFEEGLRRTVEWYLNNDEWLEELSSGAYQDYYREMYGED